MTSSFTEQPVLFACKGETLMGIIHQPEAMAKQAVLIVVGGPQYRVGSHRQFLLLARALAKQGIAVMRFDYRGMGDSEGDARPFDAVDEDIKAAIDTFYEQCPTIESVVIWGLCDAASAALFYGYQDERVKGLVLLNPWVFTEQGAAKTYLKHYYLQRLLSRDLWRKLFTLQFDYQASLSSLRQLVAKLSQPVAAQESVDDQKSDLVDADLPLPVRMRESLSRFNHPVLLILSGRDLVADEFREVVKADEEWSALLKMERLSKVDCAEADHTFSSARARDRVVLLTLEWVKGVSMPRCVAKGNRF